MAMKKGLCVLIACLVVVLTPALSYAAGCCCMQTSRMDMSSEMHEDMPCHDSAPDKVEFKGCLCDQGVVTPSLLPSLQQNSSIIFHEMVHFEDVSDHPVTAPQKRLLRPPITRS